ncbi:MAG: type-4 uracil-DNA glycosylase [Thermoprotei archaeon]|nr:type-4 uracil-DNA glycosylase [Thermoprotei archaeon]
MKSSDYETLVSEILACEKCPLSRSRTRAVPGEGSLDSIIMFVGEAPGKSEDEQGRPFVGAAGKLLNTLLESIGLERGGVYITNVVKCRPPENREPEEPEVRACNPYLVRQLNIVNPKIVVALGRIAGKTLYEMCGLKWHNMRVARREVVKCRVGEASFKLVATYHPAAALYNPGLREELEEDFRERIAKVASQVGGKTKTLEDFLLRGKKEPTTSQEG